MDIIFTILGSSEKGRYHFASGFEGVIIGNSTATVTDVETNVTSTKTLNNFRMYAQKKIHQVIFVLVNPNLDAMACSVS